MSTSLIAADNTWVLWAIITGWAAVSIYLEQRYKWAAKISGAIIALLGALVLSNFGIIPTDSPVYDSIWGYVVPLALPMLLMQCDMRKIWRESGRLLLIFSIGACATLAGSFIAYFLLKDFIPELAGLASMITGSYVGGTVNFIALADSFHVSSEMVSSAVVADNLLMALYFFALIFISGSNFFLSKYKHPHVDEVEKMGTDKSQTLAAQYWTRKEISLKDIAFTFAISCIIVAISTELAAFISSVIPTTNPILGMLNAFLGNKYLLITTISMLCATFRPGFFGEIKGTQEFGTFLVYLFLVVIGAPASIMMILQNSPLLLVFCTIVVVVNMTVMLGVGKIFNFTLEEIVLASNANIGGPTTAAAMAISKGWTKMVAPILLVGVMGYVVGTYLGIFIGTVLGA